jgi:RHS repeat-associated protein
VTYDAAGGHVAAAHAYADNGTYTVVIRATETGADAAWGEGSATVTVNNVAPVVTPAGPQVLVAEPTSGGIIQIGKLAKVVGTFTDPGYSFAPVGEETFTASIDWGDGSPPGNLAIVLAETPAGGPSGGELRITNGGHKYAQLGTYKVVVTVTDDDGGQGQASFAVLVTDSPPPPVVHVPFGGDPSEPAPKFFVVDATANVSFRYSNTGESLGLYELGPSGAAPVGVTSNASGSRQWVIDEDGRVSVYDRGGAFYGSWLALGLTQPTDLTTDGVDIWVVDGEQDAVFRYAGAAAAVAGYLQPTDSFALATRNDNATGLVTDGTQFWVVDDGESEDAVWVYTMGGDRLGSWTLPNGDPTGIALSLAGESSDLWIIDRAGGHIAVYEDAREWLDGERNMSERLTLQPSNADAVGIADPYPMPGDAFVLFSPATVRAETGSPLLISGRATFEGEPAAAVLVNGRAVDTLDAAGNFFYRLSVLAGETAYHVEGLDSHGEPKAGEALVTVTGTAADAGRIDQRDLLDVTAATEVEYKTTSLDRRTGMLYADYAVENLAKTALGGPLYVGVRHLSRPTVVVEGYAGRLDDGTPYYDLSELLPEGGYLESNKSSGVVRLMFSNPDVLPFTYELVVLAKPNLAPQIVSPPAVLAAAEKPYVYALDGYDPEGKALTYRVITAPWLQPPIADLERPEVTWTPGSEDVGSHVITIRVTDPLGAAGEQSFVLTVADPGSPVNGPPVFRSDPVAEAFVGTPYKYQTVVFDPDYDDVDVDFAPGPGYAPPAGMMISQGGLVTWEPSAAQVGQLHWVQLVATDGLHKAYQTYAVRVLPERGNHPPVFVSTPRTKLELPSGSFPATDNVAPPFLPPPSASPLLKLGNGETSPTYSVSLNSVDSRAAVMDMDVFVLFDTHADKPFQQQVSNPVVPLVVGKALDVAINGGKYFDGTDFITVTGLLDDQKTKDTSFGFGVGRFQSYADEGELGDESLPYLLNLPVVTEDSPRIADGIWDLSSVILASAQRQGFDEVSYKNEQSSQLRLRSLIEGLHQLATGKGFDDNANKSVLDNRHAGSVDAQNIPLTIITGTGTGGVPETRRYSPIANGDVPSLESFEPDDVLMLPAPEGDRGGAGFRRHSVPLIIVIKAEKGGDYHVTFRDDVGGAGGTLSGRGGDTVSAGAFFETANAVYPDGSSYQHYAGLQQTIDELVSLGAMVTGIRGREPGVSGTADPWGDQVKAIAQMTGAVDAGGSPLDYSFDYVEDMAAYHEGNSVELGGAIVRAVKDVLTAASIDYRVELVSSDPAVKVTAEPQSQSVNALFGTPPTSLDFDVTFTGDGKAHAFDLLFVQSGTGNVLGSIPVKINTVGYDYTAIAVDPDGDALEYSLLPAQPGDVYPAGAGIDKQTGVISWTPTAKVEATFHVKVEDGRGGFAVQDFKVSVTEGRADNDGPKFVSEDHAATAVGRFFQHQAQATDPDGDALRYYLVRPPMGMSIDAKSGLITWTPRPLHVGSRTVEVRASDGWGKVGVQQLEIAIAPRTALNQPPVIGPEAGKLLKAPATANVPLAVQVTATDAEGDVVTFDLPIRPDGAGIDPVTGWLVWTPTIAQVGVHQLVVRAKDSHGGADVESYQVTVAPDNLPPMITSYAQGTPTVNRPFEYRVQAQDPNPTDKLYYDLEGELAGMAISADGRFTWQPTAAQKGLRTVTVIVRDRPTGGLDDRQELSWNIGDTTPNTPPYILSTPRKYVGVGESYLYELRVVDLDGDPVYVTSVTLDTTDAKFYPEFVEEGQVIARDVVVWKPAFGDIGPHEFSITVDDEDVAPNSAGATPRFQKWTVHVQGSGAPNNAPVFSTSVTDIAKAGQHFLAHLTAEDPDGDPVRYELLQAPPGVSIDAMLGTVAWRPLAEQVGAHVFRVRASDSYGASDELTWTVKVGGYNLPPRIVSVPPLQVGVGQPYLYAVSVVDSDALTFHLEKPPHLMTIGSNGVITWTPTAAGNYPVRIEVSDGEFTGVQEYTVLVTAAAYNLPPAIVSVPLVTAVAGLPYEYQVFASDPNGDNLTYSIETADPPGASIDENGLLTWAATETKEPMIVRVAVDDGQLKARQTYLLSVRQGNNRPFFATSPPAKVLSGKTYRYDAAATDPDNDPVSYTLVSVSPGMSALKLEPGGRVTWNTVGVAAGKYTAVLEASDPFQGSDTQSVTIEVFLDTEPPAVSLTVPAFQVAAGSQFQVKVAATDNVAVASRTLEYRNTGANWVGVPVGADGTAHIKAQNKAGTVELKAGATDDAGNASLTVEGVTTKSVDVFVPAPSDGKSPVVTLKFVDGTVVTEPTVVAAEITDTPQQELWWSLSLAPVGQLEPARVLGSGQFDKSFSGNFKGPFGTIDPTLLPAGLYTLTLTASDYTNEAQASSAVRIEGNLKLGQLTFSVTDMTVPVAGVPITVTRTYDSTRVDGAGPLGPGWRIEATAGRAQSDISADWNIDPGMYPPVRDKNQIAVTMPDGSARRFEFQPQKAGFGSIILYYVPVFVAVDGSRDRLVVDQSAKLNISSDGTYYGDGYVYNPFDPFFGGAVIVRTRAGQEYRFAEDTSDNTVPRGTAGRLTSVTDRHGNRLGFSDAGVTSRSPVENPDGTVTMGAGKSVTFNWDPSHRRIIEVVDPRGKKVTYGYDKTSGSLTSSTDRSNNTTTYAYDSATNLLKSVTDAAGRETLTAKFDAGRIQTLTDADGKSATFTFDVPQRSQTITMTVDKTPLESTQLFDVIGNVTKSVDAAGASAETAYGTGSDRHLPVEIRQNDKTGLAPLTTKLEYTADGDVASTTDPTGKVTRIVSYDAFGQPRMVVDPLDHVTLNDYDAKTGDLLSTTSHEGVVSSFTHDPQGNVESVTRGDSVSKFRYDDYGRLVSQTTPDGVETKTVYAATLTDNYRETTTNWVNPLNSSDTVALTTRTTFDDEDREIQVTDARKNSTATTYDILGRVRTTTDAHKGVTTTYYDKRGLVTQTATPGAPLHLVTRTVYDDLGRAVWTLDAAPDSSFDPAAGATDTNTGRGTLTEYDKAGRVTWTRRYADVKIALTKADALTYTSAMTGHGALLSATQTEYDDFGRVAWTQSAVSLKLNDEWHAKTAYVYDKAGRQTKTTTSSVHVVTAGGQTTVTETADTVTETGYDDAGRVVWTRSPSDVRSAKGEVQYVTTEMEHDGDGRLMTTLYPDGTSTRLGYDGQGRKGSETDALGRVTAFGYDAKTGRLTSVTQPEVADHLGVKTSPVTKYGYDKYGNLTSITDALGRQTTFTFNAYGQQESRTLPFDLTTAKATEEKFYNDFGDVDYTIDFNGAKVESVYDYEDAKYGAKLGRLMGILDQSGQPLETYEYDGYGRRSKVTQAGGDVYGYAYDAEGRLTQETMPAGAISYGYDQTTGRHTSTETSKTHVNYGYDPFGRLTSLDVTKRGGAALTPSEVTQYEYTPAGNVETVEVKSGSVTLRSSEYRYDAERPWVEWLTHQAAKTVPDPVDPNQTITELRPASQFVYQRTADGQVAKVVESVGQPAGGFDVTTAVYTYDALNRLTKEATATTAAVPPSTSRTVSYTLDVVGNRWRQTTDDNGTVTVTDGTFNVRDQLTGQVTTIGGTQVGSTTFTYDLNGAETQRKSQNGDTTDSKWTVLGRLGDVTVTVGGIQTNVHYSYNPDGIRTAEMVTTGGAAVTTRHLVDSVNPTGYQQDLELRASDGELLETIVIGLELLSRTGHDTDGTTAYSALTTYLLTDVHSGVRQRAGLVGVVAATRFAAFGEVAGRAYWSGDATDDPNGHLYRGEYTDPVTGAVYLRQRWYELATGSFVSVDPLAYQGHDLPLPPYVFAIGNPLNLVDPTGLYPNEQSQRFGYRVEKVIQSSYRHGHPNQTVLYSQPGSSGNLGGLMAAAKPDILNISRLKYMEIKPLSPSGIAKASVQMATRKKHFPRFSPDISWHALPRLGLTSAGEQFVYFNVLGVLFYRQGDQELLDRVTAFLGVMAPSGVLELIAQLANIKDWISYGRRLIAAAQSANNARFDSSFAVGMLLGI